MKNAETDKLSELSEQIRNLKAVKCRVVHERVRIDKESGLPVLRHVPEPVYVRTGLCSPEIRAGRISCGHTMARYFLEDALTLLDSEEKDLKGLRMELKEITDGIHALDHQKGDAEKYLGELIEKKQLRPESHSATDLNRASEQVKLLEQKHSDYVERIATVREKILSELQNKIKDFEEN